STDGGNRTVARTLRWICNTYNISEERAGDLYPNQPIRPIQNMASDTKSDIDSDTNFNDNNNDNKNDNNNNNNNSVNDYDTDDGGINLNHSNQDHSEETEGQLHEIGQSE
ncbi:hypothetical protein BGZ76_010036, partial [Entomortierella beljakovae]